MGVRYDDFTFPDGLFLKYGCESGLGFSSDVPAHFYDSAEGTFVQLSQGTKLCILKVRVDWMKRL